MSNSTQLHRQLLEYLRQYSHYCDLRHLAALALLYGTLMGVTVQIEGWRQQVDPHWKRGLSYLKIGLRWLQGVVGKNRRLLDLRTIPSHEPQPSFASAKAHQTYYDQIWFSRIRLLNCNTV
jgi:hypothetical protein